MRTTREQSEATGRAILAEARRRFGLDGYAAVGLTEIAESTGLTRGAVYHHYGSKLGLFTAVVAQLQAEVGERVEREAMAAGDDLWQQLQRGSRAFIDAALAPDAQRLLLVEAPAVIGWQRWRALDAEHSGRHLEEALVALGDSGELALAHPAAAARLLSGAMNEAVLWIAESEDPVRAREHALIELDRLLDGLRPR